MHNAIRGTEAGIGRKKEAREGKGEGKREGRGKEGKDK